MTIGENIKKIRLEKGLSQKELGKILDVSQQMIGQYENPNSNLKPETIKKIAIALHCRIDELIDAPFYIGVSDLFAIGGAEQMEKEVLKDHLIESYNKLNRLGREEAFKRVDELTEINKYIEKDPEPPAL